MASRIREMFSSNEDPVRDFRTSNHHAYKQHHHGPLPVVELRVPMCCEKCREKVQEELEDLEGVRTVVCDQFHQHVTVTGFVDPLKVLKKVKKVKKKSEFFTQGSYINKTSGQAHGPHRDAGPYTGQNSVHRDSVRHTGQPSLHRDSVAHAVQPSLRRVSVAHAVQPSLHQDSVRYAGQSSGHRESVRYADRVSGHRDSVRYAGQAPGHGGSVRHAGQPMVHGGPGLTRTNSFERGLSRQPSFGKVTHYDGLRHHDFETRDLQRDYYGIRRMPSFKKHRYHDAEYISMGDEFMPQFGETHYARSERPMLQSQVSFSKLPVRNPHYVQPAYHELY